MKIDFTREDSERLVRVEQNLIATNEKLDSFLKTYETHNEQLQRVERHQSWIKGVGVTVTFVLSCFIALLRH